MRPIKFRAWDKKKSEMWDWYSPANGFGRNGVFVSFEDAVKYEWELMQFTGLLDKNGKEIYEGDVVQCDVRIEGRVFKKARGEVLYADNVAAFCVMLDDEYGSMRTGPSTDGSRYALPMEQLRDFIIIGNIYENPELINA